jgi:hypothetical protein
MIKEKEKTTKSYRLLFVDKIKASKKEIEEGNFIRVKKENLPQFLGLNLK